MRALVHLAVLLPFLTGCAASSKLIRYGKLDVNTEVTESVFLDPRVDSRTVHVILTNTSGVDAPLGEAIEPLLLERGWTLVDSAKEATYLLQVNVLQVTRRLLDENQDLRETILSAASAGATAGMVAAVLANATDVADEVALVSGIVSFIADAATTHPAYVMLTDVRITQTLPQSGGQRRQSTQQTRIASGASKVNLELKEAMPPLLDSTARGIVGILSPVGGARRQSGA